MGEPTLNIQINYLLNKLKEENEFCPGFIAGTPQYEELMKYAPNYKQALAWLVDNNYVRERQREISPFGEWGPDARTYKTSYYELSGKGVEKVHAVASGLKVTRKGIFVGGEYFDAFTVAAELIAQAQDKVIAIDGYVNVDTLKLLAGKKAGVELKVLTKPRSITQTFEVAAHAFNRQHMGLSVRTSEEFHDRFIIIDNIDYYHFGASIKDLGRRSFMFSRIEEPEIIGKLRDKFADEWKNAKVVL